MTLQYIKLNSNETKVVGYTYQYKDVLKGNGGFFNPDDKVWVIPNDKV